MPAILSFLVIPAKAGIQAWPTWLAQHDHENVGAGTRVCPTWLLRQGGHGGPPLRTFTKKDQFSGKSPMTAIFGYIVISAHAGIQA